MDRNRKGNPPNNVLAFRIPERTEAPSIEDVVSSLVEDAIRLMREADAIRQKAVDRTSAAAWTCATCPESESCALVEPCERHATGQVIAFPKPKPARRQVDHRAEAARLFDEALRLRRAERAERKGRI